METTSIMISGSQCRAARALVELKREELALGSGVDASVIEAFERKLDMPGNADRDRIKRALEAAGASFITENGGGAGVRLKFSRTDTRRISTLEGEGGIVSTDDVP